MTFFPDPPPFPDLATPVQRLAEQLKRMVDGLQSADAAGEKISESLKTAKKNFEQAMKRKPPL